MKSIPLLGYYTVRVWGIVLKLERNIIDSILSVSLKTEEGISEILAPPTLSHPHRVTTEEQGSTRGCVGPKPDLDDAKKILDSPDD
jgi:hypothetical protein